MELHAGSQEGQRFGAGLTEAEVRRFQTILREHCGVDLPLPPPKSKTGIDFGSDPTLAFDSSGNLFYGYIVVFFARGNGINGTQMAVARSTDGGETYPSATFFDFENGANHFNDKPMITADANLGSPFRDNVYIAWDAASGGSIGGGVRLATSTDHGATFSTKRVDDLSGPGKSIGASPAVGPNGEVYVAWNDYAANAIVFNSSFDGGQTWGNPVTISPKTLPFDIGIRADRGAHAGALGAEGVHELSRRGYAGLAALRRNIADA